MRQLILSCYIIPEHSFKKERKKKNIFFLVTKTFACGENMRDFLKLNYLFFSFERNKNRNGGGFKFSLSKISEFRVEIERKLFYTRSGI